MPKWPCELMDYIGRLNFGPDLTTLFCSSDRFGNRSVPGRDHVAHQRPIFIIGRDLGEDKVEKFSCLPRG